MANANPESLNEYIPSIGGINKVEVYRIDIDDLSHELTVRGHSAKIAFHAKWYLCLTHFEGTLNTNEGPLNGEYFIINLNSKATEQEYFESCNMWSRRLFWDVHILTKDEKDITRNLSRTFIEPDGPKWDATFNFRLIFDNAEIQKDNAFAIKLVLRDIIEEKLVQNDFKVSDHVQGTMNRLAEQLLDSSSGDVVISIRSDSDGGRTEIYAWKHILATASEYFAARFSKICHSPDDGPPRPNPENNLVTGEIASSSGTTPDRDWVTAQGRTIIYIDNFDFTTIHNIIYYLYTGRVNLHHSPETHKANAISIPDGYPDPVDPFQLYIASNRYLAKYLQKQCYEFLVKTCTPENICGRLFNIACLPHEDLTKEFLDYLIDNYQEVKFTEGWTKLHKKMASFTLVEIDFFSGLLLRISMLDQFTQEEESEDENDESEQDDDDDADGVDADEDPHGLMSALTT